MDTSLFSKYQLVKKTKETEYGELLTEFQEQINLGRLGTKHLPMNKARIGVCLKRFKKLKGVTDEKNYQPIYILLSECKDAGNRAVKRNEKYCDGFSKKFFFEIKPPTK